MLMTWQEKSKGTLIRKQCPDTTADSSEQEHGHASPCQHREVGTMDGDTAELQTSPHLTTPSLRLEL